MQWHEPIYFVEIRGVQDFATLRVRIAERTQGVIPAVGFVVFEYVSREATRSVHTRLNVGRGGATKPVCTVPSTMKRK